MLSPIPSPSRTPAQTRPANPVRRVHTCNHTCGFDGSRTRQDPTRASRTHQSNRALPCIVALSVPPLGQDGSALGASPAPCTQFGGVCEVRYSAGTSPASRQGWASVVPRAHPEGRLARVGPAVPRRGASPPGAVIVAPSNAGELVVSNPAVTPSLTSNARLSCSVVQPVGSPTIKPSGRGSEIAAAPTCRLAM